MVEKESALTMNLHAEEGSCFTEENYGIEKNSKRKKAMKISGRSKHILVLCAIANFFSGCSFSVMAPFYPTEAEKKGMKPVEIGFIFSIFELIIFISSPIIGNYLSKIGPKFVYMSGIFFGGSCNVIFGTLHLCPPDMSFVVLSFLTRSLQAFGFSCYVNTSFAIVSSEFPKNISMAFGILQTATGTGMMLGPVLGGALYEIGGFGLPFYVVGAGVLINGLVVWFFLPDPTNIGKRNSSLLSLMRNPIMLTAMLCICTGALGMTFLEPTLAKHLEPFRLGTVTVSLFFVIPPLMNSITASLWGYLTDARKIQGPIIVFGQLFFSIGFFLIGPGVIFPFLSFEIWSVTLGLVLVGVSFSAILIASMKCLVIGALEQGFDDNLDTYGITAGIFNSVYTLGGFFGPMLGGVLGEKYSLSLSFTIVAFMGTGMTLFTCLFFVHRHFRSRSYSSLFTFKGTMYKTVSTTDDNDYDFYEAK